MKKILKKLSLGFGSIVIILIAYYLLINRLDANAIEVNTVSLDSLSTPELLPSLFIGGERFYIKIQTKNGDTVLAFGDTGGGISMALPAAVDKLQVQSEVRHGLLKGIVPMKYIIFRDLVPDKKIPSPVLLRSWSIRTPFKRLQESFLFVPPNVGETKMFSDIMNSDFFLGQNFFMKRSWTFDYIKRQIWVNTPLSDADMTNPSVQKIGIKKNQNNEPIYGHASMKIEVNGEPIDVLFDCGATFILSDSGKKVFNTTAKTMGGSFIAASIFDKWHKEHPEWKYYAKADGGKDIIEMPTVKIGIYEVGPVLFSKRPDEVWSKGMIASMDKVVKGAIGGSALKYFKVTIDYNSELIKFER